MAQPIGLANFLFRDLIKYILPTTVGLILLLPFFFEQIDLEAVVFAAVVVGYIATPLVGNSFESFNFVKQRYASVDKKFKTHTQRWDFTKMFYAMDKENRNSLYLTDGYRVFYLLVSAYMLTTLAVIVVAAVWKTTHYVLLEWPVEPIAIGKALLAQNVPTIVGAAPWWLLAPIAWAAHKRALRDAATEYKVLFDDQYPSYARRFHEDEDYPSLAKSVWGQVYQGDQVLGEAQLCVVDGRSKKVLAEASSNNDGEFILKDKYSMCLNRPLVMKISTKKDAMGEIPFRVQRNETPEFRFQLASDSSQS